MAIAAAGGAAGKLAMLIASDQRTPGCGGNRSALTHDIEHGTVRRVAHDDERRVARDAP
jgi:hypothetical protein